MKPDPIALESGEGRFILPLALLLMPEEKEADERSVVLHEYSHAETFMGSEYYSAYASRALLSGNYAIKRHVSGFAEAVPSMLAELGGRHQHGTCADGEAVDVIVEATRIYGEHFRSAWMKVMSTPASTDLSPEYVFDKTVSMAIVKAAMARAEKEASADGELQPVELVRNMLRQLKGHVFPAPDPGMFLDDHVAALMFGGSRTHAAMFGPQILLAEILMKCDMKVILDHLILLPVVARLELFFEGWKPCQFHSSFFTHQSRYHKLRIAHWARLIGAHPYRPGVYEAIAKLQLCFMPLAIDKLPVVPKQYSDPQAMARLHQILSLVSARQFFRDLPAFLDWFIDRQMGFPPFKRELDCLRAGADDAAATYFKVVEERVANYQGRAPDRSLDDIDALYSLSPGTRPIIGNVLEISLK